MKEIRKKLEIAYEEKGQLKAADLVMKTSDDLLDELRVYASDTNERKLVFLSAVENVEVEVEEEKINADDLVLGDWSRN